MSTTSQKLEGANMDTDLVTPQEDISWTTVGVKHGWQDEVRALYHTETPPVTPESQSIQFVKLVAYLDESVALLKSALENVSEEWLEENHTNYRGEKSRYTHVTGFH